MWTGAVFNLSKNLCRVIVGRTQIFLLPLISDIFFDRSDLFGLKLHQARLVQHLGSRYTICSAQKLILSRLLANPFSFFGHFRILSLLELFVVV
jgi:hypothetical protein